MLLMVFEECRACSRFFFFSWVGLNLGSIWLCWEEPSKHQILQILTPPHLQVQGNFKALPGQVLVSDSTLWNISHCFGMAGKIRKGSKKDENSQFQMFQSWFMFQSWKPPSFRIQPGARPRLLHAQSSLSWTIFLEGKPKKTIQFGISWTLHQETPWSQWSLACLSQRFAAVSLRFREMDSWQFGRKNKISYFPGNLLKSELA